MVLASVDEIYRKDSEISDLRVALRKLAIVKRHRMASDGGTVHVGYLCKVCDQEWSKSYPETHRAHCLLATTR